MSDVEAIYRGRIRLKYGVSLSRSRADIEHTALPYVGLEHIESGTGRYLPAEVSDLYAASNEAGEQSNRFTHGDVLFGKLRPYLAKAWVAEFDGRASTELIVMTPTVFIARFLLYVCLHSNFVNAVDSSTFGSKMPRAEWEFIGSQYVPLPSLSYQRTIANYLDRETAKIDEMIVAKQRLLGILTEKRRALITNAVTCGLDLAAPMKDSGIEWLGDVPRHWKPIKLRWLFKQVKRQGFPELPPLSVYRDFGVILRESRDDNANRVPEDLDKYQLVEPGDLVINKMKAWQGSLGISALTGITSPDYVVFAPVHEEHPPFLNLLLRIPTLATVYLSMSNGIRTNQWRLEPDRFVTLELCLPPRCEQEQIVSHVESRVTKLDELYAATIESIRILRERRTALIAAAVTGQIDLESAV
jgi:type I restriction enzyme S subunit